MDIIVKDTVTSSVCQNQKTQEQNMTFLDLLFLFSNYLIFPLPSTLKVLNKHRHTVSISSPPVISWIHSNQDLMPTDSKKNLLRSQVASNCQVLCKTFSLCLTGTIRSIWQRSFLPPFWEIFFLWILEYQSLSVLFLSYRSLLLSFFCGTLPEF